jgi:ComF family protein
MLSNFDTVEFDSATARCGRAAQRGGAFCIALLRAALPQACTLCAAPSGDALICPDCANELPRVVAACPRCALPATNGERCGACLAAPPPYAATIAAWQYRFPVDRLLHAFKYGGRLALAEPLAIALADAVSARGAPWPDRLLALPLSARRQRARGFNHAREIARRVASRTGVPLGPGLRRVRDTPPQAGLAQAARVRNVRRVFEASPLTGLTVAIVDDVMTTGATLGAAAAAARDAGAARVEAWVVARTLPPAQAGRAPEQHGIPKER